MRNVTPGRFLYIAEDIQYALHIRLQVLADGEYAVEFNGSPLV